MFCCDALGDFALLLQRPQRVPRLLQHELELGDLLGHVIDDGLLLAQRLEVDPHIVEEMHDGVRLVLDFVDHLAPRVD